MAVRIELDRRAWNTRFAPLAVLAYQYEQWQLLEPLRALDSIAKHIYYSPSDKVTQLIAGLLAGCVYVSEVNTRLRPEAILARRWGWPAWAEQSTLARLLDQLSQSNLTTLRDGLQQISRRLSAVATHDWRAYLRLEMDLTALPCSIHAQGGEYGYVSGKKNSLHAS